MILSTPDSDTDDNRNNQQSDFRRGTERAIFRIQATEEKGVLIDV